MRSTFGLVSNGGVRGIVLWGFRVFVFLAGHGLVVLGVWGVPVIVCRLDIPQLGTYKTYKRAFIGFVGCLSGGLDSERHVTCRLSMQERGERFSAFLA